MSPTVRAVLIALAVTACADVVAPRNEIQYALETIDGEPLPVVLLTDYDVTVSVESDIVTLRDDSTFVEIARFRGVAEDRDLTVTDSVTGTYSIAGTTLYLLIAGGRASQMRINGDSLTQDFGRLLVYRRGEPRGCRMNATSRGEFLSFQQSRAKCAQRALADGDNRENGRSIHLAHRLLAEDDQSRRGGRSHDRPEGSAECRRLGLARAGAKLHADHGSDGAHHGRESHRLQRANDVVVGLAAVRPCDEERHRHARSRSEYSAARLSRKRARLGGAHRLCVQRGGDENRQ
jgi:hypothetical protein